MSNFLHCIYYKSSLASNVEIEYAKVTKNTQRLIMLFTFLFQDMVSAFVVAMAFAIFAAILAGGKRRNILLWVFLTFMFLFPFIILMALPYIEKKPDVFISKGKPVKKLKIPNNSNGLELAFYTKCNELIEQCSTEQKNFNDLLSTTDEPKDIDRRCNLSQRGYRQIKKNSELETKAIYSHYSLYSGKVRKLIKKHKEIKLLCEHEVNRLEGIEVDIENGNFHNTLLKTSSENPIHCSGCGARVSVSQAKCQYCQVYLR